MGNLNVRATQGLVVRMGMVQYRAMLPAPTSSAPQSSPPTPSPTGFGLAMLLVGIVIGYLIHPSIASVIAPVSPTSLAVAASPPVNDATAMFTPTPDTAQATQAAALMEAVIVRTRHFKGNPTAPITLIEFGDFQ